MAYNLSKLLSAPCRRLPVARFDNLYLLALVAFLAANVTQAATFTYRGAGENRSLTIAENELAVFSHDYVAPVGGTSTQTLQGSVWTKVALPSSTSLNTTMSVASSYSTGYVSPVLKDGDGQDMYVWPSILISFPSGTSATVVDAMIALMPSVTDTRLISSPYTNALAAGPNQTLSLDGGYDIYRVDLAVDDGWAVLSTVQTLTSSPGAARTIQPSFTFKARTLVSVPNDPLWPGLWHLESAQNYDVDALTTWDRTMGYSSVKVAVFDLGIQQNHPDLPVAGGYNATSVGSVDQWYPTEYWQNHGTQVAGFVNAASNNGIGVAGVAPRITLLSVKIGRDFDAASGTFQMDDERVVAALEWARAQNVRVTNHSWGRHPLYPSPAIDEAFENARIGSKMVHFGAAGNNAHRGDPRILWPASSTSVVAVGAIDSNGVRSYFSNYGTDLELAAPGSSLWTTDRTGAEGGSTDDYWQGSGTSFASPIAAACAALVVSKNPTLSAQQVESVLRSTARDLGSAGKDNLYGYGLVRPKNALDATAPYVFFGSTDSSNGWKQHAVYGWIHDVTFPWFWHAQHGWQWTSSTSPSSFTVWDSTCGDWLYTTINSGGTYPHFYRFGTNTWYYYYPNTSNPRAFYNMSTGTVEYF